MMSFGLMKLLKKLKALQQKNLRQFALVPVPWVTLHFLSKRDQKSYSLVQSIHTS